MIRLAPALVIALAGTIALGAELPPSEKSSPAPTDDAIAVAKREFDAVKEARSALPTTSGGTLPNISAPELHLGTESPAAAAVRSLPGKRDAKKKSENWLVDGVMKGANRGSPDSTGVTLDGETATEDAAINRNSNLDSARSDRAKTDQDKAAGKPADLVSNPLSQFMAGWMTPQDYTLLRPGMNGDAAADRGSRGDPSLPAMATGPGIGDFGENSLASTLGGPGGPADVPAAPRDNPFLQSFVPPPPLASSTPSAGPATPALVPRPPNPPAAPPPMQSAVPDFAKPSDDAKYFKQLKRF